MTSELPKAAGDQLSTALRARVAARLDPLSDRERTTGLDPQSMIEFYALDIPADVEPSIATVFPAEVHDA
ncbi:MAG TPA: hypothetical protein VM600_04070 [Actinomycetota bacterium]|nr:hypothetical protein [Actinomycetota bacterium]